MEFGMKRNMDLIRELLLHFEARNSQSRDKGVTLEGYDTITIQYHLLLLAQSGLIDFEADRSKTNPDRLINVYPFGLSWAGHEFLDMARNDTIWNKAKEKIAATAISVSVELLKAVLTNVAKEQIG